jgi:hypothetical protein
VALYRLLANEFSSKLLLFCALAVGRLKFMKIAFSNTVSSLRQFLATASSPSVSNAAVQHGPIALPNLLCTPVSVAQNLCPRNGPANA